MIIMNIIIISSAEARVRGRQDAAPSVEHGGDAGLFYDIFHIMLDQ